MIDKKCPWEGRILLVDDEESIRTVGRMMLERIGYEVITAADGHEAITIYQNKKDIIDLVLLDLTMPIMDGEETYQELFKINPTIRVIVSSGYNSQEIAARFAMKGWVGFIQKPFTFQELAGKIQSSMPAPLSNH